MKHWTGAIALLALAACGTASEEAPAPEASAEPSVADTAPSSGAADALLGGLVIPQQAGRFAPRNACSAIPGVMDFRRKLAEAVLERDEDALLALVDPDIKLDFGGSSGREELRSRLDADGYHLWQEFDAVLPLGCAGDEDMITIPWYFAQETTKDPFEAFLVTGEDVPIHGQPDPESEVKGRISWEFVNFVQPLDPAAVMQRVQLADGSEGYIANRKLRSAIDYRLLANRQDGEWLVTAFVAGD